MKRIILLALLLPSVAAHGAEWAYAGTSDDGHIKTYVDTSGVRVSGGIRRTWIKRQFAPHTQRGVGAYADKWTREVVGVNAYNCSDESYRTESLIWYYDDGTDYSTPTDLFPGPWLPIAPDSLVRAEWHFICAWKPK
jgi:hypothetical protein